MSKKVVQKNRSSVKRTPRRKPVKKSSSTVKKIIIYGAVLLFLVTIIGIAYQYRNGLAYYLGFKTHKVKEESEEEKRISDVRIYEVLSRHENKIFGFDVSQYQGDIKWDSISHIEDTFPLHFVFIRATAGKDKKDRSFDANWRGAKKNKLFRGAYHYYRPNENSIEQADNFIKTVKLKKGDLPPVLDIEELPKKQSMDSLKVGLQRWLDRVEAHYGKRPIIYSGDHYYKTFIKKEFSGYTNWIANYNFFVEEIREDWLFWQFTEKATIKGVDGKVDVNIFNGNYKQLNYLTIGN